MMLQFSRNNLFCFLYFSLFAFNPILNHENEGREMCAQIFFRCFCCVFFLLCTCFYMFFFLWVCVSFCFMIQQTLFNLHSNARACARGCIANENWFFCQVQQQNNQFNYQLSPYETTLSITFDLRRILFIRGIFLVSFFFNVVSYFFFLDCFDKNKTHREKKPTVSANHNHLSIRAPAEIYDAKWTAFLMWQPYGIS